MAEQRISRLFADAKLRPLASQLFKTASGKTQQGNSPAGAPQRQAAKRIRPVALPTWPLPLWGYVAPKHNIVD